MLSGGDIDSCDGDLYAFKAKFDLALSAL